jgi:hypothetical protein
MFRVKLDTSVIFINRNKWTQWVSILYSTVYTVSIQASMQMLFYVPASYIVYLSDFCRFLLCTCGWERGGGRGGLEKGRGLFWAQMALATLVPFKGPKKSRFLGPPPLKCTSLWTVPPQNHFVPHHINNRYINSYFIDKKIQCFSQREYSEIYRKSF